MPSKNKLWTMKALTKAEEQVMQVLWKLEKAFLRDIVDGMAEPKPHQNTVATLLKILMEKQLVKGYFEGSFSNVVSFLVKENNISVEELESLLQQIKKQQNNKK